MLCNSNTNQYQSCVLCHWTFILSLYLYKILLQKVWARWKHLLIPGKGTWHCFGAAPPPIYMVTSKKSFPNENHCSAAGPDTLISNHRWCWEKEFFLSSHEGVFQNKSPPNIYIRKIENLNHYHTSVANKRIQTFKPCKAELQCMFTGTWIPA